MGNNIVEIIGGSGLYDISGLTNTRWQRIDSPFGEASDELLLGELDGLLLGRVEIGTVLVRPDRVVANSDFANEIGTHKVAVLAHRHNSVLYGRPVVKN